MQRNESTQSFSEVAPYCKDSTAITRIFSGLLGCFDLRYINSLLSSSKGQGVDAGNVFQVLFTLPFLDFDNVNQLMRSGCQEAFAHGKDVFYGFLNNPRIDWRRILQLFAKQVLRIIAARTDATDGPRFLIFDDSTLPKTGKKIELIGKVFDHCGNTYRLGMKLLTLGYCDGKTFLPLDFSLHHEPGKNGKRGLRASDLKAQYKKQRPPESPGALRAAEVGTDKITMALSMLKRTLKKITKAEYVLADSWFITEKFIRGVRRSGKGLHVLGLMKTNRMVVVGGKTIKASKVPETKRKLIKKSNKLKCRYITCNISYKGITMRAYWVKMNGQDSWKMLTGTDEKLTFLRAMEYYQVRWSIEVFFKDCKQNLKLGKCHSNDFDAQTASITTVFMNYMALALKKRFDAYETLGALFRGFKEDMLEMTLVQKLWQILQIVFNSCLANMDVNWDAFMRNLIKNQRHIQNQLEKTLNSLFSINRTSNQKNALI